MIYYGSDPTRDELAVQIRQAHPEYSDAQVEQAVNDYFSSTLTPGVNAGASNMPTIVTPLPSTKDDAEEQALASVFEPKSIVPLLVAGAGAYLLFS